MVKRHFDYLIVVSRNSIENKNYKRYEGFNRVRLDAKPPVYNNIFLEMMIRAPVSYIKKQVDTQSPPEIACQSSRLSITSQKAEGSHETIGMR